MVKSLVEDTTTSCRSSEIKTFQRKETECDVRAESPVLRSTGHVEMFWEAGGLVVKLLSWTFLLDRVL